jgi:hypothetical protein
MVDDARAALAGWEAERPRNFYDATPNLARALRTHRGDDGDAALESRLREFGATVAQVVEPAARTQERVGNGPRLVEQTDALGRELQELEFHPAHDDAGRAV